ncbi:MAG: FtsW/RodA/SpoVE family cell cycle protein, partial [Lentisphaeria bacterium]|nr:FtsW/RodA/SpoVE family cell cycle protein [Lentisphaeria bacterium]
VIVLTAIPFLLIYKEPDLGTALVLLPIVGAILFSAHLKLRWILALLILLMATAPVLYMNLKPYQKERIYTFLNPESDPTDLGWNAVQANLAVGRGGVTGKGFMEGTHCSLGYLPRTVANSDFIFPVIAEETGFIGAFLLLMLYAVLMFSILRTAMLAPDDFGRYLCVGIGALLITHVAVNIGMCIQLLPITGLPLPLVSYGGSFMVSMMIYLGIIQSVYAHRKQDSFLSE